MVAPAAFTARAVSRVCSEDSTEQGSGDDGDVVPADRHPANLEYGWLGVVLAAWELVALRDAQHLLDAADDLQIRLQLRGNRNPDYADDRRVVADRKMRTQANLVDARDDAIQLLLCVSQLHDDDHVYLPCDARRVSCNV
jgi:hypothetical protein